MVFVATVNFDKPSRAGNRLWFALFTAAPGVLYLLNFWYLFISCSIHHRKFRIQKKQAPSSAPLANSTTNLRRSRLFEVEMGWDWDHSLPIAHHIMFPRRVPCGIISSTVQVKNTTFQSATSPESEFIRTTTNSGPSCLDIFPSVSDYKDHEGDCMDRDSDEVLNLNHYAGDQDMTRLGLIASSPNSGSGTSIISAGDKNQQQPKQPNQVDRDCDEELNASMHSGDGNNTKTEKPDSEAEESSNIQGSGSQISQGKELAEGAICESCHIP
jgi:hypothetical protein